MRRICWPMGVPPGSTLSSTARPAARRGWASKRACVLLPLPSGPSKVMKRPRSVVDIVQDLFQILPRFLLCVLIIGPQQVRGMVGHHHLNVAPAMPFSAQARDAVLGVEHGLGRRGSQQTDGFGLDRLKLTGKELAADFHFVSLRRPSFRRPV